MKYQTIVDNIAKIQKICTVSLSKWLEWCLSKVFNEQWWSKGVVSRLSDKQKQRININNETEISKIDLITLLRILTSNRNDLLRLGFLQVKDRTTIEKMFVVKNRWAHLSSNIFTLDTILEDLQTSIDFLVIFSIGKESLQKEVESLVHTLKVEGITDVPAMVQTFSTIGQSSNLHETGSDIKQGDIIYLKANPTAKGMVRKISTVGITKKYDVFIDGGIKSFYEGQIELENIDTAAKTVSIAELLRSLTAFQINKPSFDSLYSLNAAKVDFVPYQFRPALKLIKSDVPRLLIADSVGVGKTIEAGLILKELHARSALNNVLIICPKPLVAERKWEMEMKDKFDEEFSPVDGGRLRNILKDCDRNGEWPNRYGKAIIPYSILMNEEVINGNHPRIPGLKDIDPPPHFDLVIVDEAHHIRNSYTNVHKAVRYFCENADAVVFLTATPLQLGSNDLFTLLNVLFPDRVIDKTTFDAMTAPNSFIHKAVRDLRLGDGYEGEVIELLKSVAETEWGKKVIVPNPLYMQIINRIEKGRFSRTDRVRLIDETESLNSLSNMINRTRRIDIADSFCIRDAHTLRSRFTAYQQEIHDTLIDFETQVLTILHGGRNIKFMMSTLRHQAASCIFGLAPSIETLTNKGVAAITDNYDLDGDIVLSESEANTIVEMAINLIELSKNLPEEDSKFDKLLEIINEKQKLDNNKIILFTSFRHTQSYLERRIKQKTGLRVAVVNGDVKDDTRYNIRERFAQPRNEEVAIDILLFTEVGSEGLDYQFCDTIVNYDLPWNPMRIEQRIGRIDRRGQKNEKVHIYNCITEGTLDADIYDRCLDRIGIFEQNIGDCAEILGELADGIEKIVFDNSLTAEQRAEKLEKLAENEVRNIRETQKLENESKEFFGIDISDFTASLDRADNQWFSANSIRHLVEGYFENRLNDGKKHLEGRLLRLSAEAKLPIKEDNTALGFKEKIWSGFLRSPEQSCRITFEQDEARNDPKAIFINPTHPLARQAAKFYANSGEMQIALSISSIDIPVGIYPFSLYSWEYTGERPYVRLEPICENELIRSEFHDIIRSAIQVQLDADNYAEAWGALENKHLRLWETANAKYREDAQNLCNYKIESLTQSYHQRIRIAETRGIESIRDGEVANLTADFEAKTARLKDIAEKADIHFSLLVKGVFIIKGEQDVRCQ
ncbi:MAG: DEAD/DEAH box helicase [Treponema sp.]|jgi:superfamily II DNA or RNA helicase|nr:DEAD/DEAH box helicase [Treponema sp.]